MLAEPRTHVRQRSIARSDVDEREIRAVEPLLEPELEKPTYAPVPPRRSNATLALAWVASLLIVAIGTYSLATTRPTDRFGSFSRGFDTELYAARSAINLKKQQFEGSLDFKERHGFIPTDSPSLKYIGSSNDVDDAWDELTKDRYFRLSDDEAHRAFGDDIAKYWNEHHGGYAAGLDVLHTLHCLNHLRQTLYPDVYLMDPQNTLTHSAHCIDHMRQLTMCHADLTPIPTQFFPGLAQNYINSSREHTCRDFWQIRDWATERFNGSTAVKPRNRDGSPRDNFYGPWG